MDYIDSVIRAIDYIEDRLQEEMRTEEVAEFVGFSLYHFHRIFQSITRDSITEYVRKRRLTHAANELFYSNIRIIELAIKYQFETQEAFTRAFKKMFYMPPGQFRKQTNMKETMFHLMEKKPLVDSLLQHLQGGITMEPVYVTKESFQVVGMQIHSSETHHFGIVWDRFVPRIAEIEKKTNPERILYGVIQPTRINMEFNYIACAEVSEEGVIPEEMVYKVFPSNLYAVFTHKGSLNKLMDSYMYIYSTWFPKSGKLRSEGPEFERYGEKYLGPMHEESEVELYIPIRP